MKKLFLLVIIVSAVFAFGCSDKEKNALETDLIWTNGNIGAVENGPSNPTVITLEQDSLVVAIMNYHYFNNGVKPGTISLIGADGKTYGPWQAKGRVGQGNVENAYWDTFPNIELKAGDYQVIDSDPATWSQNSESENRGFTEVRGNYL
jgi:hypothetical protein